MRVPRCLVVGLMVVAIAGSAWAQKAPEVKTIGKDLKKLDGYVEFDASKILGQAQADVNLLLEEALLKVMAEALKEDQPELAELLQDIKLIQVQVFKGLSEQEKKYFDKVSDLIRWLKETHAWNTVVSVNKNGKTVDILMLTVNEAIAGLALFVGKPSKFVFINIAGEFDPETLGGKLRTVFAKLSEGGLDLSELGEMLGNIQNAGKESERSTGAMTKIKEPSLVVTGVVKDAATGKPIDVATVSDDEYGPKPYKGAITDAAGKYHYVTWAEEHGIIATAPGYKPQRRTIDAGMLQTDNEIVIDFSLEAE